MFQSENLESTMQLKNAEMSKKKKNHFHVMRIYIE